MAETIPALYDTEFIPLEKKLIHAFYYIPRLKFYWLIAEVNYEDNLAWGYANLHDDQCAEWGYIDLNELVEHGAVKAANWQPLPFKLAEEKARKVVR